MVGGQDASSTYSVVLETQAPSGLLGTASGLARGVLYFVTMGFISQYHLIKVVIIDRESSARLANREWGRNYEGALVDHRAISDDLGSMSARAFAEKYSVSVDRSTG